MRIHILLAHVVPVMLAVISVSAIAADVESGDGVRLELSARGRAVGLRIGATALPLRAPGGFSIADFHDQPKPVNRVLNPGFEDGEKGWRLAKGQSLDQRISHSGKCSARLEVAGPEPATSNLEVVVPVKPHTRYRVGMWLRRQQVGVCGVYSSERDDQNKLTGKQTQTGVSIPKQDGVWHPLSWEITTEPKTTRLSLRGNIYRSTGTLWLDDFFIEELSEGVFDTVEGTVEASGKDTVVFRGSLPQRGLALEAKFRTDVQGLRVDGVVRDTTGRDRAVAVKFGLPLDLAGWKWSHDAEERDTIQSGPAYRRTYRCVSGIGVCSVYPWSAISGSSAGLSIALPLAEGPRVFVLQHDQRVPETSLTFYFGLSKDARRHASSAPFSLVLYRHDPAWGMRSAMERYYRLFPESFVKRPTFEGYLNYVGMERFDPADHQLVVSSKYQFDDASDFGEGYKYLWHLHGCYDYRQVPCEDRTLPSDEKVFSLLRAMVEAEKTRPRGYAPTAETLKKLVFGPKQQISYIGDTKYWQAHEGYNQTDQPGWGLNFRVHEDPDISPVLADAARRKADKYITTPNRRPWDAMFTADAIEGYFANSAGIDYRREHFATTLVPLTFGFGNLLPAIPNTIWDFHHKFWWPLTENCKIATYGNANGYEQFFTMPFVDVPMTEGDWDPKHPGRVDRFMRAVNYRKIWRYWHAWDKSGGYGDKDPANVRNHFRRGLAYAIYPAVACVQGAGDLEAYRALYRQYVPAIEELSKAGWEPIPYATASQGAIAERFGSFEQGELHFTLRNYTDAPVQSKLVLDRQGLGIPAQAQLVCMDILPAAPTLSAFAPEGQAIDLESQGSRAFWVGTRQQAAQHGFRLAAATLEKLERLFSTEMKESDRAAWKTAVEMARSGSQASGEQALAQAEKLQQWAARCQSELTTRSPVDLAKLLFRLQTQVSLAPVAILGLKSECARLVSDTPWGKDSLASWRLGTSAIAVTNLEAVAVSPWPEIAAKCRTTPTTGHLPGGQDTRIKAALFVPSAPPRRLLPYLLQVRGKAGNAPFTVATPVDIQPVHVPAAVPGTPR